MATRFVAAALIGFGMMLGAAFASDAPKPEAQPSPYKIIKTDVRIPFAGTAVRGFQVGEDGSLILDAGSKWYRATLWAPCDRDLNFEHEIALVSRPTDTLDKFSRVVVDRNRCAIHTLDQIEPPVKAPKKGKEKPAPAPAS